MELLAINGGPQAVTLDQQQANMWPVIDEEVTEAVVAQLKTGKLSFSETILEFEREFADYHGSKYALAHNNGTASIHAALFALGIGPGDEIVTPATTFWGTYMPILSCQAVPVFCDIDPFTGCADPEDIERRISSRTKALIIVHYKGVPANMDAVLKLTKRHGISLVEDCSHAHGATYKGVKVGTFGDIGCFSLQSTKLLPCGEGGIIITNQLEYYERAICLGHYERIPNLQTEAYRKYKTTSFGFKYRMSSLSAAIARVQLRHLDRRNKDRDQNVKYLLKSIAQCDGIHPIELPDYIFRGYYGPPYVRYQANDLGGLAKEKLIQALQAEGVNVQDDAPGKMRENRDSGHLTALFQEQNHTAFARP
ncbi:TPA: DegT/DnrJ/EryC1/StrS family aminotransferase, partial [Candidatus Poribacteria bacterium]|nr:DegT/DnrJ/EryC1/StrS family aminotransferase [Candidatus Poribacteria bacterium]